MNRNRIQELSIKASAREYGGWAKTGIAVFFVLDALTTALYGSVLGTNMFSTGYEVLNQVMGGIYLLLLFNIAFFVWEFADLHLAETKTQRRIAVTMKWASFVGSLITSAAYVASYSGLWVPSQGFLDQTSWLVWLLASSAVVLQTLAGGWFLVNSVAHKEASEEAEHRIGLRDRYKQIRQTVMSRALDDMEAEFEANYLPEFRRQSYAALMNDMLDSIGYSEQGAQETRRIPDAIPPQLPSRPRRERQTRVTQVPYQNGHSSPPADQDSPLS